MYLFTNGAIKLAKTTPNKPNPKYKKVKVNRI